MTTGKSIWRRLLFIPPLLVGIAIVAFVVKNREGPVRTPVVEAARSVRAITVAEVAVIPRALSFGTVKPGKVWDAVAEISGQVIFVHPQFKSGAILAKDTVLLRIDPTDYQLAVREIEADTRAVRASIKELDARRQNTQASLAIDNQSLAIAEGELKRKRTLLARRNASQAAVDLEERNLLSRRQSVQGLKNRLNLLPAERERLNAQLAAMAIRLENAKRNLARTTIRLPFDARLAEISIEKAQFAKKGQVLAVADSIDVAEISAQIQVDKLLQLVDAARLSTVNPLTAAGNLNELLGLTPIVRLKSGSLVAQWKGRVVRVSDRVDPRTRTVGVIVAVDDPYKLGGKLGGGAFRPPLAKNMYVEVELRGRAQAKQIVVPRAALHGGRVYVAGTDNRLKIKSVTLRYRVGDLAVVKSGLTAGERIVVSDLIPAIDGMLLSVIIDADEENKLRAEAIGEGSLR